MMGEGTSWWGRGFGDDVQGCSGHSQEVVRSASGHVGLTATGGGIKLKAGKGRRFVIDVYLMEATLG